MLRALCRSQGELKTAQRKASPQLTAYNATPTAPSLTLQSPMSLLPSHTFPGDRAKKCMQAVQLTSQWAATEKGQQLPKMSVSTGDTEARKRTLGTPCLQCHPLGTLVPLGVDVRCVVWWEWGQGVHSQRVLVTLNHHRCEPGKRGKGQEASVIHGIGCQPRTNGILVFLGAGLTALIPITVVWTLGLEFINLFNSSWSSLPQLRRTDGESSENMQVSQHSNLSSIHLTVLSWNQR